MRTQCPRCRGSGAEDVIFHAVEGRDDYLDEPIRCEYCDGFGTLCDGTQGEAVVAGIRRGGHFRQGSFIFHGPTRQEVPVSSLPEETIVVFWGAPLAEGYE